jgi:hypothetical protein
VENLKRSGGYSMPERFHNEVRTFVRTFRQSCLKASFFVQSIYQNDAHNGHGACFGPHPCPSASGMLRDPEHDSLFLVEMPAGEGIRMSKKRVEWVFFPTQPVLVDSWKSVRT